MGHRQELHHRSGSPAERAAPHPASRNLHPASWHSSKGSHSPVPPRAGPRHSQMCSPLTSSPAINMHASVLIELVKHCLGPEKYFSISFSSQTRLKQQTRNFFLMFLSHSWKVQEKYQRRKWEMSTSHIFPITGLFLPVPPCPMGTVGSCLVLTQLYGWCCLYFSVTKLPTGPNRLPQPGKPHLRWLQPSVYSCSVDKVGTKLTPKPAAARKGGTSSKPCASTQAQRSLCPQALQQHPHSTHLPIHTFLFSVFKSEGPA